MELDKERLYAQLYKQLGIQPLAIWLSSLFIYKMKKLSEVTS